MSELMDILKQMKVSDLKKEISKQNKDFKGYSKMKKQDVIELMLKQEDKFKYLLKSAVKAEVKAEVKKSRPPIKITNFVEPKKKVKFESVLGKATKKSRVPLKGKIILPVKKTPMKASIIKSKPEVKPSKKKLDMSKDELLLERLLKDEVVLKQKLEMSSKKTRLDDNANLLENKMKIFELEDKIAGTNEKKRAIIEKKTQATFTKIVKDFIKNPNQDLLDVIDDQFDRVDELDQKLVDKLERAISKFEKQ